MSHNKPCTVVCARVPIPDSVLLTPIVTGDIFGPPELVYAFYEKLHAFKLNVNSKTRGT